MALVTLAVGGRSYELHCREGEEDRLHALAARVDAKAAEAARALGPTNEARRLLMAALLLADDLAEAEAGQPLSVPSEDATEGLAEALEELAGRVEALADRLEPGAAAP